MEALENGSGSDGLPDSFPSETQRKEKTHKFETASNLRAPCS
jgi:hypothetical protein